MAEDQIAKEQHVKQLKAEITEARNKEHQLGNSHASRESLLTFDMLERHPLVTDQTAYEFQWDKVDALYQFVDTIPAWIVDRCIMEIWRTGDETAPDSFRNWETKKVEFGQALML